MTTAMTPYLQFGGVAREAMEFYHSVFGGELSMMTYQEGMNDGNPATAGLIMHSSLYLDRGLHLMGADAPPEMNVTGNGTIALSGDGSGGQADVDTLRGWWEKLSTGARIDVPLDKAPWGDYFGQLTDKFGVSWMFDIGDAEMS
ncbi:VOC family protein [Glutamicibacter sp. MNS18]|uniref:VOC family protein n=1 Tax=Glutamicibacter sp. MNS18 TaxID=2989817 RepID=UPI002235CB4C|nr:VOC family protein [Glutamicibacter sp. MNS18]MCW4465780.1 VOC family protein [Glutamicibacter sp. MNS18]